MMCKDGRGSCFLSFKKNWRHYEREVHLRVWMRWLGQRPHRKIRSDGFLAICRVALIGSLARSSFFLSCFVVSRPRMSETLQESCKDLGRLSSSIWACVCTMEQINGLLITEILV
jgi:hypothetical protein